MKIRTIIVDDEPLARERIRTLLQNEPDFQVIAEYKNGAEALEGIVRQKPELVFLDVQMPEMDGLDVLQKLSPEQTPAIIFVTAYDQYAVQAFEFHTLDYLLKPFDRERFGKTLTRAREQLLRKDGEFQTRLWSLFQDLEQRPHGGAPRPLQRLAVRNAGSIIFVDTDDIEWIESAGNYLELHIEKKSHLYRETMAEMEKRLDPEKFLRIHRSIIVNLDRIEELKPRAGGEYDIFLKSDARLTSSRGYREHIRNYLSRIQ